MVTSPAVGRVAGLAETRLVVGATSPCPISLTSTKISAWATPPGETSCCRPEGATVRATYGTAEAGTRTQYVQYAGLRGQAALRPRYVPNAGGCYAQPVRTQQAAPRRTCQLSCRLCRARAVMLLRFGSNWMLPLTPALLSASHQAIVSSTSAPESTHATNPVRVYV